MTPLVLLPGMMCDARLFAPQIDAFSGMRAILLGNLVRNATVEGMAKSVLDVAPARFALCGLSMGGIVAMEVLRQAPERVDRIALLDTNPLAELEAVKARRIPQMAAARDGGLAAIMRDEMKPNYLADGPDRAQILDLCMDMALGLGPDVFLNQSRALMDRPDQTQTLRWADLPALVLCGREDALCPLERHELMAGLLQNSDFVVVENAGHLSTLEQPGAVNSALSRWLGI